ncbi:MAG: ABC transporter ATP-binding protein [Kiloniellales bacterium]
MSSDTPLLEVRNLHIALRADDERFPIVEGIDFAVAPGEVLALVGESGCGKSVTAQSLLQLLPRELEIASGEILFRRCQASPAVDLARLPKDGRDIRRIRGNEIAMIFQEPMSSFSPLHTVGAQIVEVLRLHLKLGKAAARARTIELLDLVGIGDPDRAVDQYPYEFSGGMRQRAMIAKALSCNPALLIADEPTTALDVTIQAQILELMRDLQRELRMAIVFITHDLGVVAQLADQVAIMYMGQIVERGVVRDVFKDPRHPYTVNLIRAIPRLGDLKARRQLEPIRGSVPSLRDRPDGCSFHPRCDAFMAGRCDSLAPTSRGVAPAHSVSCHLYG